MRMQRRIRQSAAAAAAVEQEAPAPAVATTVASIWVAGNCMHHLIYLISFATTSK